MDSQQEFAAFINMTSTSRTSGAPRLLSEDHNDLALLLSAVFDALEMRNPWEVLARLDFFWARLGMHIRSENLHLLPAIAARVDKSFNQEGVRPIDQALAQLREDHDLFMHQLAGGIKSMREATTVSLANAGVRMSELEMMLLELRRRLEVHNRLEEDIVYRLPRTLLDEAAQSDLESEVRKELENLPPRFKDTR